MRDVGKMEITERLREWSTYDDPPGVTLDDLLNEAADEIDRLCKIAMEQSVTMQQACSLVAEANNSLFGSKAYFHSANGGPFDKYHLARAIEGLKRASVAKGAENDRLKAALEEIGKTELHRVARSDIWMKNKAIDALALTSREGTLE